MGSVGLDLVLKAFKAPRTQTGFGNPGPGGAWGGVGSVGLGGILGKSDLVLKSFKRPGFKSGLGIRGRAGLGPGGAWGVVGLNLCALQGPGSIRVWECGAGWQARKLSTGALRPPLAFLCQGVLGRQGGLRLLVPLGPKLTSPPLP